MRIGSGSILSLALLAAIGCPVAMSAPGQHIAGWGMGMCRKQDGKWRMLNPHNSQAQPEPVPAANP